MFIFNRSEHQRDCAMKNILFPILIIMMGVTFAFTGCGGGSSPTIPAPIENVTTIQTTNPDTHRTILGRGRFLIDETGEITIIPNRESDLHFDITWVLFPPVCYDCFKIELINQEGEDWFIKFIITNSFNITAYDLRLTLTEVGGIILKNAPDSYTCTFAPPDDPSPTNPFYIFNTGVGNNEWGPMSTGSRILGFQKPVGAKFIDIEFLIDASLPDNQEEPVKIYNADFSAGSLYNDGSDSTELICMVLDWQGDITGVYADLSPIGGNQASVLLMDPGGSWSLTEISCATGISPGEKTIWIRADSADDSVYNKLTILVKEPPPPSTIAEWTMLLYLHEGGLPDDEDINELEMSGSLEDKLNIIVLWDKDYEQDKLVKVEHDPGGYNFNLISTNLPDTGGLIPPGGLDMSQPETLESFLLWGMEEYPANHYILDLWDHGAGIFKGDDDAIDFRNVCGGLSLWDIRDACENALAAQEYVDKFDIIGFDVCLLSWVETTYALKDVTDIVIASQNTEPGPGWDYGPPFINLRDNIDTWPAEQLAYDIVQSYYESYTFDHPYHYPVDNITQAASLTSELEANVIPALNTFAQSMIDNLTDYKPQLAACRAATSYWGYTVSDIGHFAYECTQEPSLPVDIRNAAQDVMDAVDGAIIHEMHNYGVPDQASGWKIWFPTNIDNEFPGYVNQYLNPEFLGFGETLWDEFLYAFGVYTGGGSDILVIDVSPYYVGDAISNSLQSFGLSVDYDYFYNIADYPLNDYQAVFITIGMWDFYWYYWPDQNDFDAIEDYLNNGGKVYMESGDTWYLNELFGGPDFCPLFGVGATSDGGLTDVDYLVGESGTPLDGMTFEYTGNQDFPDWLYATGDGNLVMSNNNPDFGTMVVTDNGTSKTVAFSLEFDGIDSGGSGNTQHDLMSKIVDFFEL